MSAFKFYNLSLLQLRKCFYYELQLSHRILKEFAFKHYIKFICSKSRHIDRLFIYNNHNGEYIY